MRRLGNYSKRSLTRGEARQLAKELKAIGAKLPKTGYCTRALGGEVCRHPKYSHDKSDSGVQVIGVDWSPKSSSKGKR